MISRKVLWFLALALAGVMAVTWWAGRYPARVAIINQAGALRNVTLYAGDEAFEIGEVQRGGTRTVVIPSGRLLTLRYTTSVERTWRSQKPASPAQSIVLTIRPNERVEVRSAIGKRR